MQTREGEVMEWPSLLPTEAVPTTLCSESARPPRITSVSASRHAVFALTEDGALLYTQVKRSSSYAIQEIELLPLKELEGVHVAQIATRFGQAFAVTNDGSVYAWGMKSGDPCQPAYTCSMGFGEISTLVHPTPLPCFGPGSTPIRFVTVGVSHTIFVSVFGEVYTVGRNEFSKLGLGINMRAPGAGLESPESAFSITTSTGHRGCCCWCQAYPAPGGQWRSLGLWPGEDGDPAYEACFGHRECCLDSEAVG